MDYIGYGEVPLIIETKSHVTAENQCRILMKYMGAIIEYNKDLYASRDRKTALNEKNCPLKFWDRESALEQKIYKRLKMWEERHPIVGIVIFTILGGILISLAAGIILEAFINCHFA